MRNILYQGKWGDAVSDVISACLVISVALMVLVGVSLLWDIVVELARIINCNSMNCIPEKGVLFFATLIIIGVITVTALIRASRTKEEESNE